LTGPEAKKALKRCEGLEADVKAINPNENSSDVSKRITELTDEVSQATIPYWKKDELRNTLRALKKQVDDRERAAKAALSANVGVEAKELIEKNIGEAVLVAPLNAFSNTKALDAALKQVKTLSPTTSAMFFTVDALAGKIFCLCIAPKVTLLVYSNFPSTGQVL